MAIPRIPDDNAAPDSALVSWRSFRRALAYLRAITPLEGRNIKFTEEAQGLRISSPRVAAGGDLPEGLEGDILYHDGTEWVAIANPQPTVSAGQIALLTHNGTVPAWTVATVRELNVCESGSPVARDFLILP